MEFKAKGEFLALWGTSETRAKREILAKRVGKLPPVTGIIKKYT
jgi:hypothetical protein